MKKSCQKKVSTLTGTSVRVPLLEGSCWGWELGQLCYEPALGLGLPWITVLRGRYLPACAPGARCLSGWQYSLASHHLPPWPLLEPALQPHWSAYCPQTQLMLFYSLSTEEVPRSLLSRLSQNATSSMEPSLISTHSIPYPSFSCHCCVEMVVAAHALSPQPQSKAHALRGRECAMPWIPWFVP